MQKGEADAISVDGGYVYTAGKCGLVPVMGEYYGGECGASCPFTLSLMGDLLISEDLIFLDLWKVRGPGSGYNKLDLGNEWGVKRL